MPLLRLDGRRIHNWSTFQAYCAEVLGFPEFYGRNMDAWVDCMTSLDAPEEGMTSVHVAPPEVLVLHHAADLKKRCPDILEALVECSAFVNHCKLAVGEPAALALAFQA